ncbi:(2Fe-2S)-binding protein [Paenibacillus agricola]|uniref:(2Fe-2S)-binding protein n=1 Tax=Paenibacillus agricola TaxID=2716264 RepID=A0ABX0J849_9BACL|nr:(2Fe-2S)-binding protein [Paenibacillus agricola]NHN31018.1 (2Fe-2S)-binding protein [Paenibacillus agricola]
MKQQPPTDLINETQGAPLRCTLNGQLLELDVPTTRRVVDILREDLDMTGTKLSCEIGRCGACMILVDGEPMNSCLLMAYQVEGRSLTTIEGLSDGNQLHPVQQAFLDEGGFQCGYCTPGMVISMAGLLEHNPNPTAEQLEEGLSGNLCRCTGYGGILRAANAAVKGMNSTGCCAGRERCEHPR